MRTSDTYSRTQIILHWTVAVLILLQFLLHDPIAELWHARMTGAVPNVPSFQPHALMGIIIFALMIWRFILRLTQGTPALPADESTILKWVAHITHFALYALIILLPVSGAVAWFFGIGNAAEGHEIFSKLLFAVTALHIVGALAQHFWFKTDVLKRMVGRA